MTSTSNQSISVFYMGTMGSGKSTIHRKLPYSKYDLIDVDEIVKNQFDGDYKNPASIDKALRIMKKQISNHIEARKSFVKMGTGAGFHGLLNFLRSTHDFGFKNILIYVDVDPKVAFDRIEKRSHETGRNSTIIEKVKAKRDDSFENYQVLIGKQQPSPQHQKILSKYDLLESDQYLKLIDEYKYINK